MQYRPLKSIGFCRTKVNMNRMEVSSQALKYDRVYELMREKEAEDGEN